MAIRAAVTLASIESSRPPPAVDPFAAPPGKGRLGRASSSSGGGDGPWQQAESISSRWLAEMVSACAACPASAFGLGEAGMLLTALSECTEELPLMMAAAANGADDSLQRLIRGLADR